jgi:flagellar biosynthesis/type III secretory pathway M-ring protein FliF/YscJ
MDFLKTTSSQIAPLIQSVSPAVRVTIALVLLVVIGAGSYYWKQQGSDRVQLYAGIQLSESELGAIEMALGKSGMNDFEIVGQTIAIPREQRAAALKAIDESQATPSSIARYSKKTTSFAPFLTGAQQRNMEKTAKQEKICAMIREVQGIADVMVEYDETRSESFPRTIYRTAAVTVRAEKSRPLEDHEIATVLATVQRAVAGMTPENIVVIDGNSGIAHDWQSVQNGPRSSKDLASAKLHFEHDLKAKIESLLSQYAGAEVSVQMECEQVARDTTNDRTKANSIAMAGSPDNGQQLPVTAGSNGSARVQDYVDTKMAHTIQKVAAQQSIESTFQAHDFIPCYAAVTIRVPESFVIKLAQQVKSHTPVVSAKNSTDPSAVANKPVSREATTAEVEQCFCKVQADIKRRIAQELRAAPHPTPENSIEVLLDHDVAPTASGQSDLAALTADWLAAFEFKKYANQWYAVAVPLLLLFGVFLFRTHRRASQVEAATRQMRLHQMELANAPTSAASTASGAVNPASMEAEPIEHNELEPSEQEAKLTNQLDQAFDNDQQIGLSKEIIELIELDPRASINVFRSWLKEAA